MFRDALRMYMERNEKNEVDIASAIKVHPSTIKRYLNGGKAHRIVEESIKSLLQEEVPLRNKSGGPPEAA